MRKIAQLTLCLGIGVAVGASMLLWKKNPPLERNVARSFVMEVPLLPSYAWKRENTPPVRNLSWIPSVMRGVVHISPARMASPQKSHADMPFPPGLPALKIPFHQVWAPRQVPSEEFIPLPQAFGSGFFIDHKGYIVTNAHVLRFVMKRSHKEAQKKKQVKITLYGGQTALARVVGVDSTSDIAVLCIEKDKDGMPFFAPITWGDSHEIQEGDVVWSVGTPFGLEGTLSQGIISHKQRRLSLDGVRHVDSYIQVDAPAINHGYSGAPLCNAQGDVIGLISTICTPNGGNVGISFAIPSHVVRYVTDTLMRHGCVPRGTIGIIAAPRKQCKTNVLSRGVLIEKIEKNSPAHKADLRPHDIITHMNERPIEDVCEFFRHMNTLQPDHVVEISFLRPPDITMLQKKRLKAVQLVMDNEAVSKKEIFRTVLGMKLSAVGDLSEKTKARYGLHARHLSKGVFILALDKSSPFFSVCRPGDIILKIAPQGYALRPVSTPYMAEGIFDEAMACYHESILMEIYRPQKGVFYTTLKIGEP